MKGQLALALRVCFQMGDIEMIHNFQEQTGAAVGLVSPNEHDDWSLGPNIKDFVAYAKELLNPPETSDESLERRWMLFVNSYKNCKPAFRVLYPDFVESIDAMFEDCRFEYLTDFFLRQKGDMVLELAKPYLT